MQLGPSQQSLNIPRQLSPISMQEGSVVPPVPSLPPAAPEPSPPPRCETSADRAKRCPWQRQSGRSLQKPMLRSPCALNARRRKICTPHCLDPLNFGGVALARGMQLGCKQLLVLRARSAQVRDVCHDWLISFSSSFFLRLGFGIGSPCRLWRGSQSSVARVLRCGLRPRRRVLSR